jgi:hypothetical protein
MKKPTFCILDVHEVMGIFEREVKKLPGIEASLDDEIIVQDKLGRKQLHVVLTIDLTHDEGN